MRFSSNLWDFQDRFFPHDLESNIQNQEASHYRMDDAAVDKLLESGYAKLAIPEKLGGLGATLQQSCAVQYRLGMLNPSMAVSFNMHLFTVGLMVEHWKKAKDLSWMLLEGVAKKDALIASAFAEPGLGGNVLHSHCKAQKQGKGKFLLNGVKVPCSLAKRSQLVCLQAITDEDRPDRLIVALVPTQTKGVKVVEGRPTLGMKQSESDMMVFEDVEIPESLIFHRTVPGKDEGATFAAGMVWFALTASSLYLGLARKALNVAIESLKTSKFANGQARTQSPTLQGKLGQIITRLQTQELACVGAARYAQETAIEETLSHAFSVKQSTVREVQVIVQDLMGLVGGGSYLDSHPLSQLLQDATAIAFHPPTEPILQQIVGRMELELPWAIEIMENTV